MAKRCYYEVLGIQRSASSDEIKKAYRRKAKELHPDRNQDDNQAEARFKEANEAYDCLKDDQKKAAYDRFGHAAFENGGGGFGGARGGHPGDFGAAFADVFEDLFGDMMGRRGPGGGGRSRAQRGQDLRYNLHVSLEDAYRGLQKTISVPGSVACGECSGTGAEGATQPATCPTCAGMGKVRAQQGFFTVERTCHTCHGAGQVIDKPCRTCAGQGRVRREKTLKVNIPAGVEDGTRIRLSGEGEAGARGGPAGDLYVFLSVRRHQLFEREGADVHCRVPISMVQATLGGSIEVPTLDGKMARINVPAGAQGGHQFRMRGKGMPIVRSSQYGDMYIEINVETPTNLTSRQKELLKEFEKAGKTSPESEGFFSKVKEMFGG